MLLFIFNMYETTFSFLGCILKFRFLNLYIIIVTKIKRGFLSKKERVIVGWIRKSVVQIFSKEVFWLLLPWMRSLLDVVYETLHFFKLSEVVTSFSWIIDEILTFWGKFSYLLNRLSSEVVRPLILIRKQLTCGYFISVHHFENRKWLKIAIFG